MALKISKTLIFGFLILNMGCGVKGKPTPPDVAPLLGNGKVRYQKPAQGAPTQPKATEVDDDNLPETKEK